MSSRARSSRSKASTTCSATGPSSSSRLPAIHPGTSRFDCASIPRQIVVCADACYFADWIDTEQTPPYGFDKDQELESLRRLRALRDSGAHMIYGHDPEQWARIPRPPDTVDGRAGAWR